MEGNTAGMNINLTEWVTDSYFDLVVSQPQKISKALYKSTIRPDVELLKQEHGIPLQGSKFQNSKLWSPATSRGSITPNGYKMKWHNIGNGNIQLRLCIAVVNHSNGYEAFLCRAYNKNTNTEKREMARFKIHVAKILRNDPIRLRGTI